MEKNRVWKMADGDKRQRSFCHLFTPLVPALFSRFDFLASGGLLLSRFHSEYLCW